MLTLNGHTVEVDKFPDGTLCLKEDIGINFGEYREAQISWYFENNEELVTLIYLVGHLRSHGIWTIHLNMPYIPNARQDRVKNSEDVFTLKYFAEVINSLSFSSVLVLDPHSSVSEALFNNLIIETPAHFVKNAIADIGKRNLTLFYPDEGAMKRYSSLFDYPYAFGIKKRIWETGEIVGLEVEGPTDLIQDHKILIVDDICSRGGTFYHSAKKLRELGASEVYLFVSHCENTIFDGELLTSGLIDRVFTTNSILTMRDEKIEVYDYEQG